MRFLAGLFFTIYLSVTPAQASESGCLHFLIGDFLVELEEVGIRVASVMKKNGLCIDIQKVSTKRSIALLQTGKADGEVARVESYGDGFEGKILKVPTPLMSIKGSLLTTQTDVRSLSDIDRDDFLLGIVHKQVWMQELVGSLKETKIHVSNNDNSAIKMLELGRVDGLLMVEPLIRAHGLDKRFHVVDVNLINVHMWVHKSQKHMLARMDEAIRSYREKGGVFHRLLEN